MKYRVYSIKILIIVFFALYSIPYTLYPILAAESTPSAKPSAASAEASIKLKLEEFKKEIASKAASLKKQVSEKIQNKAFIGLVKEKTPQAISIISDNEPKNIRINQDTLYQNNISSKQKFSFKLVEADDYIAGLGDIDDLGNLVAKRLILIKDPGKEKEIIWGKITSIIAGTATVKNKESKNISVSLSKIDTDAKLGDFVIIAGYIDKNGTLGATFLYPIPQGGFIKPKKVVYPAPNGGVATPSAQEASASIKPKPTPVTKKK